MLAWQGMTWDDDRSAFLLTRPFDSRSLDAVGDWPLPSQRPAGENWEWDEGALRWVET